MLSRIHQKLGTAGFVIAIVALIMALSGAAVAAGLTGQEKQLIKKEAKKFSKSFSKQFAKQGPKGDTGATGATGAPGGNGLPGPPGTDGEDGEDGEDGTNGTNGTNGKSAEVGTATVGECSAGGVTVQVEGVPASKEAVCNGEDGEDGETGFTEVLPPEETETGVWAATFSEEGFVPISFNIPLPAEILVANTVIVAEGGTPPAECENPDKPGAASVANPEADPGFLCVYTNLFAGGGSVASIFKPSGATETGAGKVGATLFLTSAGPDAGYGTFAVTAPAAP